MSFSGHYPDFGNGGVRLCRIRYQKGGDSWTYSGPAYFFNVWVLTTVEFWNGGQMS